MLEKLTTIIREYTGDDEVVIDKESALLGDLQLSSFDLMNLVCSIEDEFGVEISDRAIKEFKTVGDVISFIEKQ